MKPSSFCTICTSHCKEELAGFLFSLSIHHPGSPVYIISDTPTEKYIKTGYIPNLKLIWYIELNEFKGDRAEMERTNTFLNFLTAKTVVMDYALLKETDTLFLDTDMIVLDTIHVDGTKKLGVSPGFINKETAAKVGYYNAGMIWTSDKTMPEKWRHYNTTSRYFEQAAIEELCNDYSYFTFGDNHNLQTWRFVVGNEPSVQIMSYIKIKKNKIMYKDKPLTTIHTHFSSPRFKQLNDYFLNLLTTAKYYREIICIYYVINKKWMFSLSNEASPWNEMILMISKRPDIQYDLNFNGYTGMYPIILKDHIYVMNQVFKFEIPKKPVLLEKMLTWLPYEERTMETFEEGATIKENYINMSKSKYGAGPIELLAFGVVPYESTLTKEEWTARSKDCQIWYMNNRHSSQVWSTILNQIFQ